MKTYYMSEMNVSDKHGGGLTLQRVLGDDLDSFDHFVQLRSPLKNFPTKEKYLAKEINAWEYAPEFERKPMPSRFSPDYFINLFKRTFNLPNPKYLDHDYYYHNLMPVVRKQVEPNSKMLVVPQSSSSVLVANTLFEELKITYGVWMMDDHMVQFNPVTGYQYPHRGFESSFRKFLTNAKVVFVISENMRKFYLDRFGVDSKVLFGPSDISTAHGTPTENAGQPVRLCYFGAMWNWQFDALAKLSKALEALDATLDIYTFNNVSPEATASPRISIKQPLPADHVKIRMRAYDGVAILYGFHDDVRPMSELNNSTKLSECLASGIPTVLVGPPYGSMTKFAEEHQCCIVLSDLKNVEQINNFKSSFSRPKRLEILERARWVAENITSTNAMRKIWKESWN